MNMIEPEIYLFGPSDLVPDREFNFKPNPDYEFSIGADHHSSLDEFIKIQRPGKYLWVDFIQNYNRQKFVGSVVETGKAVFSFGNQQMNSRSNQTEILYQVGSTIESKKYTDFSDSVMLSGSRFLQDRQNYLIHFSGQLKNNPLINSDLWLISGEVIKNGNRNTVGIVKLDYSKNMSFFNWVSEAEIDFYSGGFVSGKTGLEYESDGWVLYGGIGYSYLKTSGNERIAFGNEPTGKIRAENNSAYFHNRLNVKFNEVRFNPESVFNSPFWFISDTNNIGSNSLFIEKYSVNYQTEWIPGSNWVFKVEPDYSRKMIINAENFYLQDRTVLNFLKIKTTASYYFDRSELSAFHELNRAFDSKNNTVSAAYLPEHSVGLDLDFLADDELNRLLVCGSYRMKTKIFYDPVNFSESKFADFSEIYVKIEDFHARPVKLFAEIKLYLGDNHYYPGLIFEKYNYRAGLSLKF